MSGIFSAPKRPAIPEPPEEPDYAGAEKKAQDALRKRRQETLALGRSSTILTKSTGGFEPGSLSVKKTKLGGE